MKWLSTVVLFALLSTQAFAQPKYHSVAEMVAEQKVIRVLLDDAPGFGNQAATINLMNRLWQMNFKGEFELIYPHDEEVREKITTLFNLPKNFPAEYFYQDKNNHKILFIDENFYIDKLLHHRITPVILSVTGAHDRDKEHDCEELQACKPLSRKFADLMNADVFVKLQPWYEQDRRQDSIYLHGDSKPREVTPRGKYLLYPTATMNELREYLKQDPAGIEYARRIPALNSFIDGAVQAHFNVLPLYGYSFRESYNYQQQHEYLFPFNILQVITAARYAQLNNVRLAAKPIVIPIFYDYHPEMEDLAVLLQSDNWDRFESFGASEARQAIKELGLRNKDVFIMASLTDNDAVRTLQNLKSGQILLLAMGSTPKIVFDGIYTYQANNILPQIREGEGTLSSLLMGGKPHFRCITYWNEQYTSTKWELGFDLLSDQTLKSRLSNFYGKNGFCAKDAWQTNPTLYKVIGDFFMESTDPSSAISRYFQAIKSDTQKQENDRIYRGLEEALKAIS